jgi:hypothetical protein
VPVSHADEQTLHLVHCGLPQRTGLIHFGSQFFDPHHDPLSNKTGRFKFIARKTTSLRKK